jgi:hypothetical protein
MDLYNQPTTSDMLFNDSIKDILNDVDTGLARKSHRKLCDAVLTNFTSNTKTKKKTPYRSKDPLLQSVYTKKDQPFRNPKDNAPQGTRGAKRGWRGRGFGNKTRGNGRDQQAQSENTQRIVKWSDEQQSADTNDQ